MSNENKSLGGDAHAGLNRSVETPLAQSVTAPGAATDAQAIARELADSQAAAQRAEWLHAHKAPKDWVVLTESEVGAIKADLTRLVAERDALREDQARLDWLEGELAREQSELEIKPEAQITVSLFRKNEPITRAAIDAARNGGGK